MNIDEAFSFLNFWINTKQGAFYTIPELERLCDAAQISYYTDNKPKASTSNLVKEILSPFRATYDFSPSDTISGVIVVPSNSNYLDLLDIQITYAISNRTMYYSVPMINEDERAIRLNSQLDPVTITSPVGEILAPRFFRLYPTSGYTGTVTYYRRPTPPVYGYSVISGRVIVYNPDTSTQLEWRTTDIIPLLLKGLQSIGINLNDQEVSQWAEIKTQQNFQGVNRL